MKIQTFAEDGGVAGGSAGRGGGDGGFVGNVGK